MEEILTEKQIEEYDKKVGELYGKIPKEFHNFVIEIVNKELAIERECNI